MITPEYVQMMASYNHWQNTSLYTAADGLTDDDRRKDRGAFFGSIQATLNHILWGDQIWMDRFAGTGAPSSPTIGNSTGLQHEWAALGLARNEFDAVLTNWAATVDPHWLQGDLSWFSGAMNREVSKPVAMLVTHMFNHQTHHRGQVHAMLTAAGAKPDDTDIPFQS